MSRVGGRANRPGSRGHSRPKILALSPDFSRSSIRLLGLCPNLYLVQLPRFPRRSWAGALRPPGFTPRRSVLVTSFPGAGQWGAAGAGVFLRMGFLPNQFKFSPALRPPPAPPSLVPSSPGELESLRPSPGGWRQGGPSVEGAGDTRGDLSDVAGPLTSRPGVSAFVLPFPNH